MIFLFGIHVPNILLVCTAILDIVDSLKGSYYHEVIHVVVSMLPVPFYAVQISEGIHPAIGPHHQSETKCRNMPDMLS